MEVIIMKREKLEAMKGVELIAYADKLGVKLNCNKERTALKESKSKAIDKIVYFVKEHPTKKETSKKENIKHTFILPDCFIGNSKYYDNVKCYKIKNDKKTVAEIYPQRKSICVYVRKETDTTGYNVVKDDYKYYLPVKVTIPYEDVNRLEELIYERQ